MSGLDGIEITDHPRREEIFTPEATAFVADLVRTFRDQRIDLLRNRRIRQGSSTAACVRTSSRRPPRSAREPGPSLPLQRTSWTGGSRSPVPPSAR